MKRIPVIDLRAGVVVRAVRGERASYQPVRSALCEGSAPLTVARALLDHCAADVLYVADLDALTGGAPQLDLLAQLCRALPGIELWLDAGFADAADALALCAQLSAPLGAPPIGQAGAQAHVPAQPAGAQPAAGARVTPVLASEALASRAGLRADAPWILSLDRKGGAVLDRAGCWDHPEQWPARLIVMTLDRVGADGGPDLAMLQFVQMRAGQRALYGAGGVRGEADLDAAAAAGAAGWLLASALHDRRLGAAMRPPVQTPAQP